MKHKRILTRKNYDVAAFTRILAVNKIRGML